MTITTQHRSPTSPTSPGPAATGPSTRRSFVQSVMGMPVSIHLRGEDARSEAAAAQVARAFGLLRTIDRTFSTYREDSEIRRMARGELTLDAASPDVREVHRLCRSARERTDGTFDAWHWRPGGAVFDPTGLVKGWAIGRVGALLARDATGVMDALVDAGGDVLARASSSGPGWRVGIEDPHDRTRVLATVDLHDGAVATSGTAARGTHVVDPRDGSRADALASATVVGPSILWADVFATTALVHGATAEAWVAGLHGTSGLLVHADGRTHRWAHPA